MGTKVLGTTDNGGEADVNSQYEDKGGIAGAGRRHRDGTININALLRGAGAALAATVVAVTVVAAMALAPAEAHAQERIALASPVRTAMVTVTLGKSQDVHTDASLADIVVGDPSVADVNPLTDRSLSILGKKIGTTRVTVYDQNKKPVGIFDVEVSYDISLLSGEIRQFTGGGIKVSSINGRIMLSGTAPDAATLDKAVMIARQFVPDVNSVINTVQVMQQQQVMLEVRFMEVNRQASRELGVQWSGSNGAHTGQDGSGPGARSAVGTGAPCSRDPRHSAFSSAHWPAETLSLNASAQRARAEGPGAQPGRAQSGGAVGRHGELSRRRDNSTYRQPALPARPGQPGQLRRRPFFHAHRAQGRHCRSDNQTGGEHDRPLASR